MRSKHPHPATPPEPTEPSVPPDGTQAASPGGPASPAGSPSLQEFEQLKAKADENWTHYVRAMADLENYRKRAQRERQDAARYANAALLEKLLPSLDHFDMALAATDTPDPGSLQSLRTGIQLVHQQLRSALTEAGLETIDAQGQAFDPRIHEAVSQEPSTEVPEGQVLRQLRKGYRLHDRLLRPASVIVARKPDEASGPAVTG